MRRKGASRAAGWRSRPRPYIGPCYDPLALWFLEYDDANGETYRRYYGDRDAARTALEEFKAGRQRWAELIGGR